MNTSFTTLDHLEWEQLGSQLDQEGYAILPGLLTAQDVNSLLALGEEPGQLRTVPLAANALGRGQISYLSEQLPAPLERLREAFYDRLAPIANRWRETLGEDYRYPNTLAAFFQECDAAGQQREQSHLIHLKEQDYLSLQQRAEGSHVFPLQLVALLSAPNEAFTGGEFVMTEQRPRMQSRPLVLPLRPGDVAIIATAQRPFRGSKGYYRVNMKHAISRVRSGERLGVELSFHKA